MADSDPMRALAYASILLGAQHASNSTMTVPVQPSLPPSMGDQVAQRTASAVSPVSPSGFQTLEAAQFAARTRGGGYQAYEARPEPGARSGAVHRFRCKGTHVEDGKLIRCTAWRKLSDQGPPFMYTEEGSHTPHQPFVYQRMPVAPAFKKQVKVVLLDKRKFPRTGKSSLGRTIRSQAELSYEEFPPSEAARTKKAVRRELRAEVQVTVAELQEFVTRFSAASDDPFKGRLFSGVDDVSADRSILIVSSAALQENLTGCVDTWHLLWIGMDDDEKFLPGGWHQIMLLGHNKDHEFRPYGFAFATSKSCFLHRRVLECLVPPTLRCAAERHDTKIVTMSDRCKAIGAAFRESFPANPDPNLSASNPEHHTCDWHIRNHHATPKIRQLVRTSCINGVQGDRISQDIFLLSEAYTTAIFNAGVQALCHEWENKMPAKVRESLEPLLTCAPWYVGATPPGLNNNNLMCETANADVQRHYNDCYGEIGHAPNVIEAAEWYMTNIIPEWSREKTSWTRQRTHHKVSFGTGKTSHVKDQWEAALDLRRDGFLNQIAIDESQNPPVWYAFRETSSSKRDSFTPDDLERWKKLRQAINGDGVVTIDQWRWFMNVHVTGAPIQRWGNSEDDHPGCSCRPYQKAGTCGHDLLHSVQHRQVEIPAKYVLVRTTMQANKAVASAKSIAQSSRGPTAGPQRKIANAPSKTTAGAALRSKARGIDNPSVIC